MYYPPPATVRITRNLFLSPHMRWHIAAEMLSKPKALYYGYGPTYREALADFKENRRKFWAL